VFAQVLKESQHSNDLWTVLQGASNDDAVVKPLTKMIAVTGMQAVVFVHEIFGFFASSEGAPLALSQLKKTAPNVHTRMAPAHAGTFLVPACVRVSDLPTSETRPLYLGSKLALASNLNFDEVSLSGQEYRHFEWYDFSSDMDLKQEHTLEFTVDRDGDFNSLACFLLVHFGQHTQPGGTERTKEMGCVTKFPFGDMRSDNKLGPLSFLLAP
jgi:hypothetical protein